MCIRNKKKLSDLKLLRNKESLEIHIYARIMRLYSNITCYTL